VADDPEQTLNDLSRQMPTAEQLKAFFDTIKDQDDRAAALILASLSDNLLETCIALRFITLGKDSYARMFRSSNAPLGSFRSKLP
jgi:hypothetical protein